MLNDLMPVINKMSTADHPDKLTIVPLADAHYGAREFNETRWTNTLKRIYEDPHCFCVLVGDLIDNGLKNSVTNVYAATCPPSEQKKWLVEQLSPLAVTGKILGAVGGNHERRTAKEADQDPLYDVMLMMGKEHLYRQNICFMQIKLTYPFKGQDKQRTEFSFAITHGSGGGMYIASSANRLQNFGNAIEGIDCLITGHTHKPMTFPVCKLVFENGAILTKQFVVAVASGFLDYGGYPVQKMLTPTAQTSTEILLTYSQSYGIPKKDIRVLQ